MVFLFDKMFPQNPHDDVDQLRHFVIGQSFPEDLHELIVRELLKIDRQGGFILFPRKAKGQRSLIGLDESMGIPSHGGSLLPPSMRIEYIG